jgi:heat shock protein HspQ
MIEKDYYRLPELKDRFGFTEYDYLYLCENYNIPIRFYIHHQYFLLTEPDNENRKTNIRGAIHYKGLIEVNSIDKSSFLKHSIVNISRCFVMDKNGVTSFETSSDILIDNCFDERYVNKGLNLKELKSFPYYAIVIGEENRDLTQQENTLLTEKLSLNFKNIVITKEDIDWCKLMLELDLTSDKPREHIIHNQIKKIMRDNPTIGGTALYRKIYTNFLNENDSTDPYSLYLEVNIDEIVWGKAEKYEKTLSKRTFLNLVSKFKKENE